MSRRLRRRRRQCRAGGGRLGVTLRSTLLDAVVVTRREALLTTRGATVLATGASTLRSLGDVAAAALCPTAVDARGDVSGGGALASRHLLGRCSVVVVASDDDDDVDGKQ